MFGFKALLQPFSIRERERENDGGGAPSEASGFVSLHKAKFSHDKFRFNSFLFNKNKWPLLRRESSYLEEEVNVF